MTINGFHPDVRLPNLKNWLRMLR